MKHLSAISCLPFLVLMACQPAASPLTEGERAAIADSIEQTWADMMAGARALNPDRILAGYVPEPTVAINGVIVEDVGEHFAGIRRWLGTLRSFDADYDNVRLEVLARDAAVATMNHHLRWTDTTGAPGEWHSAWTAVFRRTAAGWKIVSSHESVYRRDSS